MSASTRPTIGSMPVSPAQAVSALIVAGVGVVIDSIGWAALALRSVHDLPTGQVASANALVPAAPAFLLVGTLHLVAAALIVAPRRATRLAGGVIAAAGAVTALATMGLVLGGTDPFASLRPTTAAATGDGLGILAVAFVVYAAVAFTAFRSAGHAR